MKRLASLMFLLALSCGDDARPAVCEQIGDACHDADSGSGTAHDCHENAHEAWSAAECSANLSMCLAACAGGGADAGPADAAP